MQPEDEEPTSWEKVMLIQLLNRATVPDYEGLRELINECPNYKFYQAIQFYLEANRQSYHHIPNPSPGDINYHLKHLKP